MNLADLVTALAAQRAEEEARGERRDEDAAAERRGDPAASSAAAATVICMQWGLMRLRFVPRRRSSAPAIPAIVLQHGFPQDWYCWAGVIGPLAQRYRVICPDMRGFGSSDAPPFGYDKESLAQDLLAVCDALGVERFSLVGHDWGGVVSFIAALRAGDRIDRLVLLNTTHLFWRVDLQFLLALRGFWYMPLVGTPLLGPWLLRRRWFVRIALDWAHPGLEWDAQERRRYLEPIRGRARGSASRRLYGSFVFSELLPNLRGRYKREHLAVPTLLLHGDGDRAVRTPLVRGYEPYAEDVRIQFIQGAGHFVVDDAPEQVAERILAFLDEDAGAQTDTAELAGTT